MSEKIIVQTPYHALPQEVEHFIQTLSQQGVITVDGKTLSVSSVEYSTITTTRTVITTKVNVVAHTEDGDVIWPFVSEEITEHAS